MTIQDKALSKMTQEEIYEFLADVDPSENNVILYDVDFATPSTAFPDFSEAQCVKDSEEDELGDLQGEPNAKAD